MTGDLRERAEVTARVAPRRATTIAWFSLALLVTGWIVLLGWLIAWGPGDHPGRDTYLYLALSIGAACAVVARGFVSTRDRKVWWALGLALLFSAAGDVTYVVSFPGTDAEHFPGTADAFYLAYYPLAIAAVVMYVRNRVRDVPAAVWRDGIVLAVAMGALVGAIFLAPLKGTIEGDIAAVIVGGSYPVADTVVLLLAGLGITLVGANRARALFWVSAGMVVLAIADLAYWNLIATDVYQEGTWIDALWPLSAILTAVGAWLPRTGRVRSRTGAGGLMMVPAASLVAATATLTFGTVRHIPLLTAVMAAAALLGVLSRLNSTVRHTLMMMEARRDASTDDLTDLPNRRGFVTQAAQLVGPEVADPSATLLVIDLDGFKEVNDSLGHVAGDEVIRALAQRLARACDAPEIVLGRLGGDEFAILHPGTRHDLAQECASRVGAVIGTPFDVDGITITLTASIGIAQAPRDGTDLSMLLRRADIAMFRAKADHLECAFFDASIDVDGEDRLQRVSELRAGIAAGELVLHYQPKIALESGAVEGLEALVRWERKGVGLVQPNDFLPLARTAGLMPALTDVVLSEALAQSARWSAVGIHLPVAVNLSASSLIDHALPERIATALEHHGVAGSSLHVEITEEALLRDPPRARMVLGQLRQLGVRVAIDDYGTGYSSLLYLKELVVDEVKIDRSFVAPMLSDPRAAFIVRSTIDLAHVLGVRVVAEGIEEADVAGMLASYGCDVAQGYHWSRPLPAAALEEWLRAYKATRVVSA